MTYLILMFKNHPLAHQLWWLSGLNVGHPMDQEVLDLIPSWGTCQGSRFDPQ